MHRDECWESRWNRLVCLFVGAALAVGLAACNGKNGKDAGAKDTGEQVQDTGIPGYDATFDTSSPVDSDSQGMDSSQPDDSTATDADGTAGDVMREKCGNTTCGPKETCVNDTKCMPANRVKCDNAKDLGTLQIGKTKTINGSFKKEPDDSLSTNCAQAQGPEKVYKFQAPTGSHAEIDVKIDEGNQTDVKLEFRQGKCLRSGDKIGEHGDCIDTDTSVFVPKGETFYLVVENDAGMGGDFTIEMTPGKACSFGGFGDYGCKMGDRYLCERVSGMPKETKQACPAPGCNNAECVGSTCSDPIVVTKSNGNSGKAMKGNLDANTNRLNFGNGNMTCSHVNMSSMPVNSNGAEVYFKIEADKGDTISFTLGPSGNDTLAYLTNSCKSNPSQISCVETWDAQTGSWTANKKGTYWLIVDRFSAVAGKMFNYKVTVQ